jgi:hypothetical protein
MSPGQWLNWHCRFFSDIDCSEFVAAKRLRARCAREWRMVARRRGVALRPLVDQRAERVMPRASVCVASPCVGRTASAGDSHGCAMAEERCREEFEKLVK